MQILPSSLQVCLICSPVLLRRGNHCAGHLLMLISNGVLWHMLCLKGCAPLRAVEGWCHSGSSVFLPLSNSLQKMHEHGLEPFSAHCMCKYELVWLVRADNCLGGLCPVLARCFAHLVLIHFGNLVYCQCWVPSSSATDLIHQREVVWNCPHVQHQGNAQE